MVGVAEEQRARASEALVRRDAGLAQKVIAGDEVIDQMDIELDDNAVRTLALRHPVANDLREVIAALKISGELERIGDYAKNVAKIGRASCRERVCQYVEISVVAVSLKKKDH